MIERRRGRAGRVEEGISKEREWSKWELGFRVVGLRVKGCDWPWAVQIRLSLLKRFSFLFFYSLNPLTILL